MYIVFEGIDNSGKSTQIELVKERLKLIFKQHGIDINVISISEPELEEVVDPQDEVELTLRFALQRRLLHKKYPSDLFRDTNPVIVLSDRSFYSSLAYQGYCEHMKLWIRNVNEFVSEPSIVFFFDRGDGDDWVTRSAYKHYFEVLPLSAVYVDTKNHSLSQTTEYICNKILGKWNKRF